MTEIKTCTTCKYYKDYRDVFEWITTRILGFPPPQLCTHPDRWKNIDYVNGTMSAYTFCSTERNCGGNCGKEGFHWEQREEEEGFVVTLLNKVLKE